MPFIERAIPGGFEKVFVPEGGTAPTTQTSQPRTTSFLKVQMPGGEVRKIFNQQEAEKAVASGGTITQAKGAAAYWAGQRPGGTPAPSTPTPSQPIDQAQVFSDRQFQLSQVQSSIDALRERIRTEGITNASGGYLLAPQSSLSLSEIKQDAPLSSDLEGMLAGAGAAAGAAKLTPTQQLLVAEMQKIQQQSQQSQSKLQSLLGQKPEPFNFQEAQSQAFQSLGLPPNFTRTQFDLLQRQAAEINALNEKMIDINKREQLKIVAIEGQPIPVEIIQRQKGALARVFAIEKASVAAEIQAKAAFMEATKGNFQLATQLVDRTLDLVMYEKQQEIADYRWMVDNYQEEFQALSNREQNMFNTLLGSLERSAELESQDMKDKINLYLNAGVTPPDMNTLKNMDYAAIAQQVVGMGKYDVSGSKTGILPSTGFANSKIEADFREDAAALNLQVRAGALSVEEAYLQLRDLYSPQEVSDEAINSFLGISAQEPQQEVQPEPISTNEDLARRIETLAPIYEKSDIAGNWKVQLRQKLIDEGFSAEDVRSANIPGGTNIIQATGNLLSSGVNAVYNFLFEGR